MLDMATQPADAASSNHTEAAAAATTCHDEMKSPLARCAVVVRCFASCATAYAQTHTNSHILTQPA